MMHEKSQTKMVNATKPITNNSHARINALQPPFQIYLAELSSAVHNTTLFYLEYHMHWLLGNVDSATTL